MNHFPFIELFKKLRNNPLLAAPGMDEYFLLMELYKQSYFEDKDLDAFVFTLETIWCKTNSGKDQFRKIIKNEVVEILKTIKNFDAHLINLKQAEEAKKNEENKEIEASKPSERMESSKPLDLPSNEKEEVKTNNDKKSEVKKQEEDLAISNEFGFNVQEGSGESELGINKPKEERLSLSPYLLSNDYIPIGERQLQQSWRQLANKHDLNFKNEIDFNATIHSISSKGYFSGFVQQKNRQNRLKLFVLIDQSDSMMVEEEFAKQLWLNAKTNGDNNHLTPWYFFKIPQSQNNGEDYRVNNEDWTQVMSLKKMFSSVPKNDSVVLIYSDAGILNLEHDDTRLEDIKKFVNFLLTNTAHAVWLNPAPKYRWKNNEAEEISNIIPMFEHDRYGLDNAIQALKGSWIRSKYSAV